MAELGNCKTMLKDVVWFCSWAMSQSTYSFLKTNADLLISVEAKMGGPNEAPSWLLCTGSAKSHHGETLGRQEDKEY